MQQKIKKVELETEYPDGIPTEYDPDLLLNLSHHQVVFFDEMHVEHEGGPTYQTKYQIRFSRDADGKYSQVSPASLIPIYAPIKN